MTGHLPGEWKLADHPEHGRVLVVRTDGENAIYATPYKATGIRTRAALVSDLTFVVIATGEHARVARQAPKEPPTDDFHSSVGLWQQRPATWEEA